MKKIINGALDVVVILTALVICTTHEDNVPDFGGINGISLVNLDD
jgi:hypothetical protein